MLEIKGIIIVFPIGNTEISACAEYALRHNVEDTDSRRFVAAATQDNVCLFHNIEC